MSRVTIGLVVVIVGVMLNNIVYLQDLWLGQPSMTLDSWRAIVAILVSIGIVIGGLWLIAKGRESQ